MSELKPVRVVCPESMVKFRIPAFNTIFTAGDNWIDNSKLMLFLLRYPSKAAKIDHNECIEKGHLTKEQVAALGIDVFDVGPGGQPVKVEVPMDLDVEIPEPIPDFALMTLVELKAWCDDDKHPVKYSQKWTKADYIKACQKAAKPLRSKQGFKD